MKDLREPMRRAMEAFEPRGDALDAVRTRRGQRRRRRRITAAATGLTVFAAGFAALGLAFRHGPVPDHPAQQGGTLALEATQRGTGAGCHATLAQTEVAPGASLQFTFWMVSPPSGMTTRGGGGYLIIQDGRGAFVSGSEAEASMIATRMRNPTGLGIADRLIPPGRSTRIEPLNVPVQWIGPLTVRPACIYEGGAIWLPTVHVQVTPTAAPSNAQRALDRALAAMGGLFDRCLPSANGQPVVGVVEPPLAATGVTAVRTRCWARVSSQGSFDVVTLYAVSPADAPEVTVPLELHSIDLPMLAGDAVIEVSRWAFVVTNHQITTIEPLESVAGGRFQNYVDYVFEDGGWSATKGCGDYPIAQGISFFLPFPPSERSKFYDWICSSDSVVPVGVATSVRGQ